MSWIQASSDGLGNGFWHYSLIKVSSRQRWTLARHGGAMHAAAYFRTEAEARRFAECFGLTITEHDQ